MKQETTNNFVTEETKGNSKHIKTNLLQTLMKPKVNMKFRREKPANYVDKEGLKLNCNRRKNVKFGRRDKLRNWQRNNNWQICNRRKNCKAISPVTGLEWPRGSQEVKVPKFHNNGT